MVTDFGYGPRMTSVRALAGLAVISIACTPALTTGATKPATALRSHPDLAVSLRGPSGELRYDPESFGPSGQIVSITIENRGTAAAPVAPLAVSLTATREGVSFPCRAPNGVQEREPSSLAPGASFTFDRELSCTLAVPGHYEVAVAIGGDRAGVLDVNVGESPRAPKAMKDRPGLFVGLAGAAVTRPLPPEAWARGDYRVVVAFINASAQPIALAPAKLAFLTYRQGATLSCSGQTNDLVLPTEIAPGAVHTVMSPVACAPAEEGVYEVVGHLEMRGAARFEIGRVRIQVTRDPLLFSPERTFDPGDPKRP